MQNQIPTSYILSPRIAQAQRSGYPVLALESAVITHGLPYPSNLELARGLEEETERWGVTPATIAILDGKVHIGLTSDQLEALAAPGAPVRKISRRDFGLVIASRGSGGTTVAGTMIAACAAGIQVFATGGIGGVHRDAPFDVSADLHELSRTPIVVVCAGAKSILDLPATVETLETMGVPVIGYQTDEFPAFFSRSSGLPVCVSVDSPEDVAAIARSHWGAGISSAVLVVVPPPAEHALPTEEVEAVIQLALQEARKDKISGAAVTPYLLAKVNDLSRGDSLRANLALLKNNASVGAQIAKTIQKPVNSWV